MIRERNLGMGSSQGSPAPEREGAGLYRGEVGGGLGAKREVPVLQVLSHTSKAARVNGSQTTQAPSWSPALL